MRYYATIGDKERLIEVEHLEGSLYTIAIDEELPFRVDATRVEGQVVNLLVDDKSYDVDLEEVEDDLNLMVQDQLFKMKLVDERARRLEQASGHFAVSGAQIVKAPMPGKVVKILVAEGDEVVQGQGVVIIEAMKMENELRAPKDGRVTKIHIAEGDTVEGRTSLVSLE